MLTPTRKFPLPGIVRHNLGPVLDHANYRLAGMLSRPCAGLIRDWRSDSLALRRAATHRSRDQHFWGAAVHRAGAGPQQLPVRNLTPERIASAIRAARDDAAMRALATSLSHRSAQEDGTGLASELIESILA